MIPVFIAFLFFTNIFETEDNRDFETLIAGLEDLRDSPVDINTAGFDQFAAIPYLSLNEIIKIVDYRTRRGFFNHTRDLLKVPGFTKVLLATIEPYVTVSARRFQLKNFTERVRLQTTPGQDRAEGFYTATKAGWNDYRTAIVTEKDPYEASYLDYCAAGLVVREDFRTFALGKYDLDLGSGAMFSSIGSFFQGLDFQMLSHERGVIPYTATRENGGLFGGVLSDSLFLKYTLFYSNQKLDGRVDDSGYARSLDESGAHVDSASRARQDRISEELLGYDLKYDFAGLQVSQTAYFCRYAPPFASADSFREFYGDRFWMTGANLRYFGSNCALFGEAARADRNRFGGLFGFSAVFPHVDFNLAAKYFPDGFYSPKGIEAEAGRYVMTIALANRSKVVDLDASLNLTEDLAEDSTRYDIKWNFGKEVGIFSTRLLMRWVFDETILTLAGSRAIIRASPRDFLYAELRLEDKNSYADITPERGWFGALEAGLKFKRWGAIVRYGLFDTDSYATRIIAYEPGLPGTLNNRMLYNRGRYGFALLTFKPLTRVAFNFKYTVLERDSLTAQFGGQVDVKW